MAANYVEGWKTGRPETQPKPLAWAVLGIYVLATGLETVFATYAIFSYKGNYARENREQSFQLNPWIMQVIDYCWFLSLPLAGSMQPKAPNLIYRYELEKMPDSTYTNVPQDSGGSEEGFETEEASTMLSTARSPRSPRYAAPCYE